VVGSVVEEAGFCFVGRNVGFDVDPMLGIVVGGAEGNFVGKRFGLDVGYLEGRFVV